jgi:hypothetical protein
MSLKVKYIGKFKGIFEMALGYESADQVGSIQEKLEVIKILLDYPFKNHKGP